MGKLTCWHLEPQPTLGFEEQPHPAPDCGATLTLVDGAWACPHGHHLRTWDDLRPYTRDHIHLMQTDPGMWHRYFDPPETDR